MTHILHTSTVHKTASLADEGNSAYCQSRGTHNIKHNLWKLALRGHLNTDAQASDRNFLLTINDALLISCFVYTEYNKLPPSFHFK